MEVFVNYKSLFLGLDMTIMLLLIFDDVVIGVGAVAIEPRTKVGVCAS